jgi:hypothetical protein
MVVSLAPTELRREEIVDQTMSQVNKIIDFAQELEEYIGQKITQVNMADLGSLAIALETIESEVETGLESLDAMRQLIQDTINSR